MQETPPSFHRFNEALISTEKERETFAGFFHSKHGIEKVYYKRDQPLTEKGPPKVHLFAVHDIGQYHGSFNFLKKFLIKKFGNDIAITLVDLKGHGLSSGTRGFVFDFKEYCQDIITLIGRDNYGAKWSREPDNILLGQGMGALVCLEALRELSFDGRVNEVKAAALSNPLLRFKHETPAYAHFALKGWRKRLGGSALGRVRVPLLHEREQENKSDPLILKQMTVSLLSEVLRSGEEIKNTPYFIDMPLLFLLGEKSSFCDVDRAALFHKGVLKKHSKCVKYPKIGHDLFNNSTRDQAFTDLYDWLSLVLGYSKND